MGKNKCCETYIQNRDLVAFHLSKTKHPFWEFGNLTCIFPIPQYFWQNSLWKTFEIEIIISTQLNSNPLNLPLNIIWRWKIISSQFNTIYWIRYDTTALHLFIYGEFIDHIMSFGNDCWYCISQSCLYDVERSPLEVKYVIPESRWFAIDVHVDTDPTIQVNIFQREPAKISNIS